MSVALLEGDEGVIWPPRQGSGIGADGLRVLLQVILLFLILCFVVFWFPAFMESRRLC